MPRSRGAATGILLVLLGVAAALAPLLGPEIGLTIGSDKTFDVTQDRLLLSILPGAAAALGGLLLLVSANRPMAMLGGLLALAGGIWLIVGPLVSRLWEDSGGLLGAAGAPAGDRTRQTIEILAYFHGIGALITALAGIALGRLAIRAASDHRHDRDHDRAHAPAPVPVPAPQPRERVVDEPVHRAPVVEEPVHRAPVVEEPVRREPVVEEPRHREPVADEPVHREPVVEEPHHRDAVIDPPVRDAEPAPDEQATRVVEPRSGAGTERLPGDEPVEAQRTEVHPPEPGPRPTGDSPRGRSGGLVDRVRGKLS
jgi:hypothetical protein